MRGSLTIIVVAVITAALFTAAPAAADTIRVPGDWPTIQQAMAEAVTGDVIEVGPGLYDGPVDFLGKAVTLRSTAGPQGTTIDGDADIAVLCVSGEKRTSVLEGFTVTEAAVGLYIEHGSPTVRQCVFINNVRAIQIATPHPLKYSSPWIEQTVFQDNHSAGNGGAIKLYRTRPVFLSCLFSDNSALWSGGAIYGTVSYPQIFACTFQGNEAGDQGGALYGEFGEWRIIGSLLAYNTAFQGGAVYLDFVEADLVSTTVARNTSAENGAVWLDWPGNGTFVANAIIWDNASGGLGWHEGGFTPRVIFSDIQNGWPGLENIQLDPLFIDPDNGDFRLSLDSPCVDKGVNWALPEDELDIDRDGDTLELLPLDFDGNPRFADVLGRGCGNAFTDIGAFESAGSPRPCVLFADVTLDGAVDVDDLIAVILDWGQEAPCCMCDLDFSGKVDTADLVGVILRWTD